MKTIFSTILLAIMVLASSCNKKEIPGPKGDPGANGTGGNSSTNSSGVFVITQAQWAAASKSYTYTYASNLITQAVVDKGSVRVFTEEENGWRELPLTIGDEMLQFSFSTGFLRFDLTDAHGNMPLEAPETRNYRFVTLSESARVLHEGGQKDKDTGILNSNLQ